jgi:hypothetical protein
MNATEISRHIEQLREWLRTHEPREDWSHQQRQAYNDRMRSLSRWISVAQHQECKT